MPQIATSAAALAEMRKRPIVSVATAYQVVAGLMSRASFYDGIRDGRWSGATVTVARRVGIKSREFLAAVGLDEDGNDAPVAPTPAVRSTLRLKAAKARPTQAAA